MFDWFRKQFRRTELRTLPLSFALDREGDQHVVQVYKQKDGVNVPIDNIALLWQYGYQEVEETPDGEIIYVLDDKDRQTLLSLRSMNPNQGKNGRLSFSFAPPILNYLRTKENIGESETSEKLQVRKTPLPVAAQIDFNPQTGITVKTGYQDPVTQEMVSAESLLKMADGEYVIVGDTFMPLPLPPSDAVKKWLDQSTTQVAKRDIPEFLKHDLVLLKEEFSTVLTDRVNQIKIAEESFKPLVKIDFDPQTGITVKTGYPDPVTQEMVSVESLLKMADGEYVIVGNTFIPLPPPPSAAIKKWLDQPVTRIANRDIPEFFQRDLVLIKKEFSAVLTDRANEIQIVQEPFKPFVKVDKNEQGWLNFEVDYKIDNVILPHSFLKGKINDPYIQVDDKTWIKNNPRSILKTEKQLKDMEAELTVNGYRTRISEFASLDEFVQSIGGTAELSAAYQTFLDQLTGFQADDTFQLSKAAEAQFKSIGINLRPYQRSGIHWLDWLYHNHLHGLLADDMGLGKTLQSICILRRAYEKTYTRQHSLILCPKSVLHHWEREINSYYPQLGVYPYHGPNRKRSLLKSVVPTIFISTYQTAANDIEYLKSVPFYYIILDEATRIKNPQAKRTHAVKALNGAHRLALSGTPVENRPAEMWSIFDFLMRGHLGKYGTFERVFEKKIAGGNDQAAIQLGKRVKPFMLRRLKEDVAKDLPEKIEMDEWCELTEEQRQLYGSYQGQVKQLHSALASGAQVNFTTSILPILQKLKQICDHPALVTNIKQPILGRSEKFDWIIAKVREIKSQGEHVVIFSHFLDMLTLLEKIIAQELISYIRIDGSTNNRQHLIDTFNQGQTTVALCSLGATSQGINLTSANHVIHADRWWNPAIEDQATDRVHRIGQDKIVYIYRIMVQGTLEERIETLLANKRKMADQIVDAAGAGAHQWTRDELMELLKPLD